MRRGGLAAGLAALSLTLGSCVFPGGVVRQYSWFEAPAAQDPWRQPIHDWQLRARAESPPQPSQETSTLDDQPELAGAYAAFRLELRRGQAEGVSDWIQGQARLHFVPDPGIDIWPTAQEVLEAGGDDCDGLAFLAHELLLELGFEREELYLAIVRRRSDALHHMVGLWFGDGADPWIIDPTGAMTAEMVRMSSLEGWDPLAIFSETEHFQALPQVATEGMLRGAARN
ncbi:MAG: hypothetical protein JRH01_07660 [Deltaproteobacteria bacterium]|nr:hypothetical protein [Deltaproteobacteria bacterium]MBW2396213.1 hypothetical protein [Deltaproteobacteria bacterium]